MNIEDLFNGIAVIVDNEIEDQTSSICKIKRLIEEKDIPVLTFREIPSMDIIPALSGTTFVVLDWDYTNGVIPTEVDGGRLFNPETLTEEENTRLILFIKKLLDELFIPIFIFTAKPKEMVIEKLIDAGLDREVHNNRLFVKQKDEVDTNEELFTAISEWVKEMPSVYVLKEWALVMKRAQNAMFNELYSYSPNWTKVIWDMLKKDSRDNQREFGDFITRQLLNRVTEYSFDDRIISSERPNSIEELMNIVESERYLQYSGPQAQAYTGDLFFDSENEEYYLNVRAQCDLARCRNPKLYLIHGKELSEDDIATEDWELTNEGILCLGMGKQYSLERLSEICQNEEELRSLNNLFSSFRKTAFFTNGNIIGKKSEIIITCVAQKKALVFRLDIDKICKYNEMRDKLIGRILPPYITQIQQSCAYFIAREGIMPTPEEIFEKI